MERLKVYKLPELHSVAWPERGRWAPILREAARIVNSYSILITLRQLYYRLVAAELIRNNTAEYSTLSSRTAALRREGRFPRLYDRTRGIMQAGYYADVETALSELAEDYRLDRTKGQKYQTYLGVEKNALSGLLFEWFDDLGLPIIPLGGYSSESLDRAVKAAVRKDGRPANLIYAGDFDASGMDIGRNFIEQTNCWHHVERIALSPEQIYAMDLTVQAGKSTDSRAPSFIEAYPEIHERYDFGSDANGRIPVQVELDAIDPEVLHTELFATALAPWWDAAVADEVLGQEQSDQQELADIAAEHAEE
jgi:hypothetical protein